MAYSKRRIEDKIKWKLVKLSKISHDIAKLINVADSICRIKFLCFGNNQYNDNGNCCSSKSTLALLFPALRKHSETSFRKLTVVYLTQAIKGCYQFNFFK